jgi:hypothetical protein
LLQLSIYAQHPKEIASLTRAPFPALMAELLKPVALSYLEEPVIAVKVL